jgi:hypothetical protein
MSLNTLAPDPWADAAHDGAVPQHHRNPGPAQPHQQQTPQQQPPPSDTSSISSSSPPASASHDDQLDRQMLRHLMKKYTAEGLTRLMQEETSSPILAGMYSICFPRISLIMGVFWHRLAVVEHMDQWLALAFTPRTIFCGLSKIVGLDPSHHITLATISCSKAGSLR